MDAVFLQCPLEDGLSGEEYIELLEKLNTVSNNIGAISVFSDNAAAFGFICFDQMDKAGLTLENVEQGVKEILRDVNKETITGEYRANGCFKLLLKHCENKDAENYQYQKFSWYK